MMTIFITKIIFRKIFGKGKKNNTKNLNIVSNDSNNVRIQYQLRNTCDQGKIIIKMYNSKISRQDFLATRFLTIKLIDLEKSLIHRNKFIFEVITDQTTDFVKKTYGELKRFATELINKFGMQQFSMESRMRSSEQYKQLEGLFKKLSNGYLMITEQATQAQLAKKMQMRNYLYNLFYTTIENPPSQDQKSQMKTDRSHSDSVISTLGHSALKSIPSYEEVSEKLQKIDKLQKLQKSQDAVLKLDEGHHHHPHLHGHHAHHPHLHHHDQQQEDKGHGSYLHRLKGLYKNRSVKGEDRKQLLARGIQLIWYLEDKHWVQKKFSLENNNLLSIVDLDSNARQIIVLKKYEVTIVEENYRRIQLDHPLLACPIQIRLRHILDAPKDEEDIEEYIRLLTLLKEAIRNLPHYQEEVVNFIGLNLSNKKNKFSQDVEKKPAKDLHFKVTHQHEVVELVLPVDSAVMIQLPIINHYSKIDVEIVQGKEARLMANWREYSMNFSLPIQNIYDLLFNEKPKRKIPEMKFFILGSKICNYSIKIDYYQRANRWSYCSLRDEDKLQGEKLPNQFTREEFRIQRNRLKRIIYYVEMNIQYLKSLINLEHPFQSYFFYAVLVMTVLFFDANFIVHYILALFAGILIYHHPSSSSYYRQLAIICGLARHMSILDKKFKQRGWNRHKVHFKKDVQKRKFIQQFKFTRKKAASIVQKYQKLHQWLLRGQLAITTMVSLSEKIKNIMVWYHHRKTQQLLLCLLVVLVVIIFIPIRLMLLGVIFKLFRKGNKFHQRTREINKVIVYEILQNIAKEEHSILLKSWISDPLKPYDRKLSEYILFERRIKEWMGSHLLVQIQQELFHECKCVNELINSLADCRRRFLIPEMVCRKYKFNLEWSQQFSGITKALHIVYGFIMNVPSDRNILGIDYEEHEKDAADFDSDELEEP